MNSKWYKVLFVIVTIFILVALSACQPAAPAAEEPAAEAPAAEEPAAEEPMEEHVKAVVLLEGPLADTGWNTSCWEAMQAMEAEYGWEVSYQDNVNTDNILIFKYLSKVLNRFIPIQTTRFRCSCRWHNRWVKYI